MGFLSLSPIGKTKSEQLERSADAQVSFNLHRKSARPSHNMDTLCVFALRRGGRIYLTSVNKNRRERPHKIAGALRQATLMPVRYVNASALTP